MSTVVIDSPSKDQSRQVIEQLPVSLDNPVAFGPRERIAERESLGWALTGRSFSTYRLSVYRIFVRPIFPLKGNGSSL